MEENAAQKLAKLQTRMEGIMEEECFNAETMARKIVRKEKRVHRKDEISLSQLEEELQVGFVELTVLRPFEKVKKNVFEMALPSWKLEDS